MNQSTIPTGAFILTVAVEFDPSDPIGRERLAAASRSLQRSWGLTIVKADEIPVSELPASTPGRLRGDEVFGGTIGQPKVTGERLNSGLTATQEDRLAAKVHKAREREARKGK